ncbi:hypothetical protein FZW96_12040 [Bacillus sp. BGMRC 2118]|nr:hypothetical protein FZW96_12040 [Bacillus sp. BGMRC 2118]
MTTEELLEDLKSYLNITWSEKDEDLKKIILRGQAYLNEKAGVTLKYAGDGLEIQLLLDYCRYVYNHSFELFESNFAGELLNLSLREGLKEHAETNTETTT